MSVVETHNGARKLKEGDMFVIFAEDWDMFAPTSLLPNQVIPFKKGKNYLVNGDKWDTGFALVPMNYDDAPEHSIYCATLQTRLIGGHSVD